MRLFLPVGLCLFLSACGISTPVVIEETTAVGSVNIVPIDANSVRSANQSDYRPRTLPAIFSRTTGYSGGLRGAGALPDPASDPQTKPANLTTRIPPAYQPGPYKIGVGDVVILATPSSTNTVEQLSGLLAAQNRRQGYTVQGDGSIAIPDIGRVKIGGRTLEEAEAELFNVLVSNQISPSFSLEVTEFNSQRVSLGGAVGTPSIVPIGLAKLSLSEAIARAGGITASQLEYASIRIYRDGTVYQVPLKAYLETPTLQQITLKPGDNVFVDTAYDLDKAQAYFGEQLALRTLRQDARATALAELQTEIGLRRAEIEEARANFATRIELDAVDRDYAYIAGEVGAQGRYTLPFERTASLADALFDKGQGVPNATGNIAEVYVLRATKDGNGIHAWHLDASNAANLVLATRFELRPNDVIFVSEKPFTALSRMLAEVAPALAILIP